MNQFLKIRPLNTISKATTTRCWLCLASTFLQIPSLVLKRKRNDGGNRQPKCAIRSKTGNMRSLQGLDLAVRGVHAHKMQSISCPWLLREFIILVLIKYKCAGVLVSSYIYILYPLLKWVSILWTVDLLPKTSAVIGNCSKIHLFTVTNADFQENELPLDCIQS